MTDSKTNRAAGTDWTGLLADPDVARNLGKLLQIYRDSPPERREETLLEALREIKQSSASASPPPQTSEPEAKPLPTPASSSPPFEPDIFTSNWAQDRRRHPRMKCFVAVELRVDDAETPLWGNLSNTSLGGCQVETAAHIHGGAKVEIGLWVATGKIWVKGLALNGVVTRSAPGGGVRLRFDGLNPAGKENLRQFLRYVQDSTRAANSENSYMQLLK